jgi:aspartate-semialdehyde dehydrogenase
MKQINVGVVGATGVVGETFMQLLEEREFPVGELRLFASANSLGQTREFGGKTWPLQVLTDGCFKGLDLVFFSSGDDISKEWAPRAVADGAFAVDNSGAFRMNPEIHLVVPEINGDLLPKPGSPAVIANPNCSTIQLVMALQPLHIKYGLKAVRVSSYQSVSGAGRDGVEELFNSTRVALEAEEAKPKIFPAPIAFNCIPQIGGFNDLGFCTEEMKIMKETNKILRTEIPVSAFTVRVPTLNGHAETAWVTLNKTVESREEIESTLAAFDGVEVIKLNQSPAYPTQKMASGTDPVYVGRVHRDLHDANTWMMWIVSDNLKKGAALNGIQIAERIFDLN